MAKHIMVDIETLGRDHDSVIASLGACVFDPVDIKEIKPEWDTFYTTFNLEEQTRLYKRSMDPSTVKFWFQQASKVVLDTMYGIVPLATGLKNFTRWYNNFKPSKVWANGTTFDIVILTSAYKDIGRTPPWRYNEVRDMRFLRDLVSEPYLKTYYDQATEQHNALQDAILQAKIVQGIISTLQLKLYEKEGIFIPTTTGE